MKPPPKQTLNSVLFIAIWGGNAESFSSYTAKVQRIVLTCRSKSMRVHLVGSWELVIVT
jgi:hypothetical protein